MLLLEGIHSNWPLACGFTFILSPYRTKNQGLQEDAVIHKLLRVLAQFLVYARRFTHS